jgi:hypothetical protein
MKDRLTQTPDGRIIRTAEAGSEAADSQRSDLACRVMQPFTEACLSLLPDRPLTGVARTGLCLFLLGACDQLWQRLGLQDSQFPDFASDMLQQQGLSAAAATTLAFTLPQLMEVDFAREILLEGASTLDEWLDGHDANCAMRLTDRDHSGSSFSM